MSLHLAEISRNVTPGNHAVVLLDGAGWHQTGGKLKLPPYSPELNPVENVWQYLRQNHLSNRIFESYDSIVDACCDACNALTAEKARIRSIAACPWASVTLQCRRYQTDKAPRSDFRLLITDSQSLTPVQAAAWTCGAVSGQHGSPETRSNQPRMFG